MSWNRDRRRPLAAGALAGAVAALALAPAAAQAVTNTTLPTITPSAEPKFDGQQLGSTPGTWGYAALESGDFSYSYQWYRCNADLVTCDPIAGATVSTYTLSSGDIGSRIQVRVTATCETNCTPDTAASDPTDPIQAVPPQNTTPPAVGGTFQEGQLAGAFAGNWAGTMPMTFALQWERCSTPDPVTCQAIPGATGIAYEFVIADVNQRVRVVVAADNAAPGITGPVASAMSGPVARAPVAAPQLLSPFPVIAIGGKLTKRGAALRLLRVRGPKGARVTVRCRGKACPFRRIRRKLNKGELRVRGLERSLRAGTVIELFVTSPSTIGKYTRFKIRKGKPPARRDGCVQPGASKGSSCPRR